MYRAFQGKQQGKQEKAFYAVEDLRSVEAKLCFAVSLNRLETLNFSTRSPISEKFVEATS